MCDGSSRLIWHERLFVGCWIVGDKRCGNSGIARSKIASTCLFGFRRSLPPYKYYCVSPSVNSYTGALRHCRITVRVRMLRATYYSLCSSARLYFVQDRTIQSMYAIFFLSGILSAGWIRNTVSATTAWQNDARGHQTRIDESEYSSTGVCSVLCRATIEIAGLLSDDRCTSEHGEVCLQVLKIVRSCVVCFTTYRHVLTAVQSTDRG